MDAASTNQSINFDVDDGLENSKRDQGIGKPKEFSNVWKFFLKRGVGQDGMQTAKCKGCKKEYKCGGKYGTYTLRRHMHLCKMLKLPNVGQMLIDHDGESMSKRIDPKVARELLANAVIQHGLPLSFVEYAGFRTLLKYVNPNLPCISRDTLISDITKVYLKEKEKLKKVLANIQNRICLTYDMWTACNSEGYICLAGHFVDENWKLNSKILCFDKMPSPHLGLELAAKVFDVLREWGIEKKVFSLTLDNASINDSVQDFLKKHLSLHESLLCDGEFFHIHCSAHILNIMVQDGLKVVNLALQKIRESVQYVKGYESRMKKFEESVDAVGITDTNIGLILDVSTCWKSTYLMLDSAIKYKKAFAFLLLLDENYTFYPSVEEWKRCEKICEFLKPFYDIANSIVSSSYPTSNLYFIQVWNIEIMLEKNLSNEDALIAEMCRRLKDKFDKYWSEYSIMLAFRAVLDPRIKLSILEHVYSKVESDPIKCQEKMSLVKAKLYKLFEYYANAATKLSSLQPQSSSIIHSSMQKIFDEIKAYQSEIMGARSQLDVYLEEPKFQFAYYEDLDVLEYWKNNMYRFPILALMARDVLAIPITTVASTSEFSIGARVLTKYKSCRLPKNVQALICTHNWLYGYVIDNEESEGQDLNDEMVDEVF